MSPRLAIADDGSAGAAGARRGARSLFPAARALILTVPSPVSVRAGTAVPVLPMHSPGAVQQALDELTAEAQERARTTAREAVEHAQSGGLHAEVAPVAPNASAWAG